MMAHANFIELNILSYGDINPKSMFYIGDL